MTAQRSLPPASPERMWHRRRRLLSAVMTLILLLLALLVVTLRDATSPPTPSTVQQHLEGPPWRHGVANARFTVVLYADLECPYCQAYFPELYRWIDTTSDVNLQWHHLPLTKHEPAASRQASLAECVGQAGGHKAFWSAVQWIYTYTRTGGQGVSDLEAFPDASQAIHTCLSSGEAMSLVQTQAHEAITSGITATPSL
ncbi:DsbA family protein, partial [Labrys sp. ZIDIC5]